MDCIKKVKTLQPYIGENVKYIIIGESPINSVHTFSNDDSDFWKGMRKYGFKKSEFAIIHSINCYADGRPSEFLRTCCRPWLSRFINEINPSIIICCGNFAMHTITGKWGINKYINKIENRILFKKSRRIIYWPNPITIKYINMDNNMKILLNIDK